MYVQPEMAAFKHTLLQSRIKDVYKLNREKLIPILNSCGLRTDVTVNEGRKLLCAYIVKERALRARSETEPLFAIDEMDSICFVCDKKIVSENWKYKLLETASKKRNVPVADLIKQLVGNDFAVLVGERDVVCSSCMNLLNLMDALTVQLKEVQETLSKLIYSKYNLESEGIKFQVQYDDSIDMKTEPLHKCNACNFETKYEKEFNIHIRTHNIKNPSPEMSTVKSKLINMKPATNIKSRSIKKRPPKIKRLDRVGNRKSTFKHKKTKVLFQCSECNKMFPSESSVKLHAKVVHGNDNIVVSDESEYEDIQTLESSDEENSLVNIEKKAPKQKKTSVKKDSLDFLDDWDEDENDDMKFINNKNTREYSLNAPSPKGDMGHNEDIEEENDENQVKPTCMYCNTKFLSYESVQDHIKMTHRDRTSSLNVKSTTSPVRSYEIDSTTDIFEKKHSNPIGNKHTTSKIKSYKCIVCGIKKVSLKFIKKHVQAHKKKMSLQCKLCGTSFRNIVALKVHSYRCYKVAAIKRKCVQCNLAFLDNNQLNIHMKKLHTKRAKSGKTYKNSQLKPTSRYSLRKTDHSLKLPKNTLKKKNMNTKTLDSTHDNSKISSCEVSSTSLENYSSIRKKYICSLCNFTSSSGLEMKGHMKKHDIEEDGKTGQVLKVNVNKFKGKEHLKCQECGTYLSNKNKLRNHMIRHKANKCYDLGICFYCDSLFVEKEQLMIHMDTKHNFKNDAKCFVCGRNYIHGKDLKLHFLRIHFSSKTENLIKRVSGETTAPNSDCTKANEVYTKVFKELQDLTGEGHDVEDMSMDVPISFMNYSCPLCDFSGCKDVVKSHLASHSQNYCNICENIFNTRESIKHIENHSIEFQSMKCTDCEGTFHDLIHLQCHSIRDHSGNKSHKCSMCDKTFASTKILWTHKHTMHGEKSKKKFSCEKCNKNFYSEKEFQTHVEFAHRSVLNCKYCDKTLNDMKKLVLHEKNHLKQVNRVYKCNVCGKVLKTPLQLKRHKKNHNSSIPLCCEVCSQTFKSFHALREHSAKHLDNQEKKFFCDVCGKGFYFYDSHYRHRRIHLDPLLFKCKSCGGRFQTKNKLLEHKESCRELVQCTKCLKSFNTNLELQEHMCLSSNINVFS